MQQDITEIPLDQWHKTFETNIHAYFYFAKLLVPHMQRGDTVINNASINAYIGRPDLLDYTSSKGGKSTETSVCPTNVANTSSSSYRLVHPRSCKSTSQQRYQGKRSLPGSGVDSTHSLFDERRLTEAIHLTSR